MATRIGINGFGRIGRSVVRAFQAAGYPKDMEIVAVNDLTDAKTLAYLTSARLGPRPLPRRGQRRRRQARRRRPRDRRHRREGARQASPGRSTASSSSSSAPAASPTRTRRQGAPRRRRQEGPHLRARQGSGRHAGLGINHRELRRRRSTTSSRTRRARPTASRPSPRCSHESFGIVKRPDDDGALVHERSVDPRSAAQGSAARARRGDVDDPDHDGRGQGAVAEVLPALKGKLDGFAVRVPTPNVSLVDLTVRVEKPADKEARSTRPSRRPPQDPSFLGVLAVTEEPLVSIDFNGDAHSSTVDCGAHDGARRDLVKVVAWYDNETGYAQRAVRARAARRTEGLVRAPQGRPGDRSPPSCRSRASACSCASTSTCRSRRPGGVADDSRIRAALPTIEHLWSAARASCSASHLGRPKGKPTSKLSLEPVGGAPGRAARHRRRASPTRSSATAPARWSNDLRDGEVALLENLRFTAGEEANDEQFARAARVLRRQLYVNDAFGTAHRAHASTVGMMKLRRRAQGRRPAHAEGDRVPRPAARRGRARPFLAVVGGAKVSDKIAVLENLLGARRRLSHRRRDGQHLPQGAGRIAGQEPRRGGQAGAVARTFLRKAEERGIEVLLPERRGRGHAARCSHGRHVVAGHESPDRRDGARHRARRRVPGFGERIAARGRSSGTAPWACSRSRPFAAGTLAVAAPWPANSRPHRWWAAATRSAAVEQTGVADKITHISTGGGASLELHRRQGAARREGAREAEEDDHVTHPARRGNWKLNKTIAEALALVTEVKNAVAPGARRRGRPWHRCSPRSTRWPRRLEGTAVALVRPGQLLGGSGRVHRRGLGQAARGRGLRLRHRRPLRAAPALRRARRRGEPQGQGRR